MIDLRRHVLLTAVLLTACGAPRPPTLAEQRRVLEAMPGQTPAHFARRGWWRYLEGDAAGAAAAFAKAGDTPLAALGRARLADDALDAATTLLEAATAAQGDGPVALIGRAWAIDASHAVPDGEARLAAALGEARGRRKALTGARHTLRISFLPHLHRAALRDHPPTRRDDKVHALGKWWALSPKAPKADADALVLTIWPLTPGEAHLELRVDGPALAWRDGALVLATPADRFPARTVRFSAPGEGPLFVAWAARKPPRVWRLSTPVPPPSHAKGPAVSGRAPTPDWLAVWLTTELALLDGDAETALRALDGAPASPTFSTLRARAAVAEAGVPARAARDVAREAWTMALPPAPARAHLELARLARRGGDEDALRTHLDAALAEAPDAWPVHQTRVRALATLGRADEARAALREAEAVAPDRCALLDDRAALEDDRTAGFDDRLVAAYTACERPLDAVERLLTLKRPEAALDRLDHDAGDDAERARKLRARALVALGQLDEARDALGDADDFESARLAIDLDAASGAVNEADTSAALTALVADHPTAHEALVFIGARPEWSPFAAFALDSEAAIAAYEATVPLPGPAVRVLDHSASLYFADGTSLRWVHEILAVRSREAAETYGELALPDQVQPLAVYTRKADGRRLFAEETPEKETLSLPDLDDGDYVVAIYLEPGDNGYLYDSGFLTPRAYFRGVDLPIFHQRLEVIGPDDTPPDHQRVHGAPPAEPIALDGRAGVRFEAHGVPLWPPEADSVPAGLWLPSARVGRRVSLRDDVDYYRDRVLARRRRTARFDAWARAAAGEGTVEKRVARLSRAVREAVDGAGGLVADDAALAVPSGEGNRALTLSAALEAAGIAHRLVLARPKVHVGAGPFLQVMDFPYPLIQLASGRFIDPGPDRAAPGFVPFPLLGGDALVVWPPDAPLGPVALPVERGVPDRRTVTLRAHWAEDGSLTGEVVDRLEGQEAIVIGRAFERLDPEDRPRLIERLLLGAVGAATVTALDDPTAQPPDGPLVLRYRFRATPGPTLRLGAFPVQPGRRYGRVGERTTPLAIDLPVDQRVHLTLTSDRPFAAKLRPGTLTEGAASFALTADVHDDEIEIETHLVVPGGAISTDVYAGFARWARDVDDAERVRLGARQETTR